MSTKIYVNIIWCRFTAQLLVLEQICIKKNLESLTRSIRWCNALFNISNSFGDNEEESHVFWKRINVTFSRLLIFHYHYTIAQKNGFYVNLILFDLFSKKVSLISVLDRFCGRGMDSVMLREKIVSLYKLMLRQWRIKRPGWGGELTGLQPGPPPFRRHQFPKIVKKTYPLIEERRFSEFQPGAPCNLNPPLWERRRWVKFMLPSTVSIMLRMRTHPP